MGEQEPLETVPILFYGSNVLAGVPHSTTLLTDTGMAARKGKILLWYLSADALMFTDPQGVVLWVKLSEDGIHWSETAGTCFAGAQICTGAFGAVNDINVRFILSVDHSLVEVIITTVDEMTTPEDYEDAALSIAVHEIRNLKDPFPNLVGCAVSGGAIWPVQEDDRCAIVWIQELNPVSGWITESFHEWTIDDELIRVWTAPEYEPEVDFEPGYPMYNLGRPVYLFPYNDKIGYSFWW
ncbi:MAG: hypothetical protein WC455_23375 [Dehalococcoidia bacterium]